MKKKVLSVLLALVLALSLSLVTAVPVAAANGVAPTIDGVLDEGEWGEPAFWSDYFDVYVMNDAEYLYVAFETLGGTYLPTGDGEVGMINVYTMNPETLECWAYCWIHRTPNLIELYYSPPRTQRSTEADFAVKATVFELQIPLSELESINLGDTINFHFASFAEGWNNWTNWWLYDQEYNTWAPPKADILKDSGIPGKGLDKAPGLQKPFNPNSQAGNNAGKK